jgi:hypothetical protein
MQSHSTGRAAVLLEVVEAVGHQAAADIRLPLMTWLR